MNNAVWKKISETVQHLESYDTEEFTPPDSVNELFDKDPDFREWLEKMLEHSARIAVNMMTDEIAEAMAAELP